MPYSRGFGLPIGNFIRPAKRPVITLSLIAINAIIYLLTSYENGFLRISDRWVALGGFIPSVLGMADQLYRLLSSMFLHSDILHILFNMYFLYIFGRAVEEALGKWRFSALYITSGVFAAVFHVAFSFLGGAPAYAIPAIGASGAISGVLGAYLILFPGTTLLIGWFFFIPIFFRMKAAYFLVMWFAMQIAYGYARLGSVAFFAHAGGFVAGMALLSLLVVRNKASRVKFVEKREQIDVFMMFTETPERVKGLSRGTKVVLTLLLVSLLVGATCALTGLFIKGYLKNIVMQYTYEGVQHVDYAGLQIPTIEYQLSVIPRSETRILLNRLYGTNLLYDEAKAGKKLEIGNWYARMLMKVGDRRVPVDVLIVSFIGKYDSEGFLDYGIGELKTQVVFINQNRVSVSDYMVHYVFEITSVTVDLVSISQVTGLISFITSALALLVVLTKDKELILIGE